MQEINYNQELLNNAINNTYLITEEGLMFEGWINEEGDIE